MSELLGRDGKPLVCRHGHSARSCDHCFEVAEARNNALEEAAAVCESLRRTTSGAIIMELRTYALNDAAEAIRALRKP